MENNVTMVSKKILYKGSIMEYKKVSTLFSYIGGKGWLKDRLRLEVDNLLKTNTGIDTYVEPFAGGLGAFLGIYDVLLSNNIKKVILNDINVKIINFYNVIKETPELLIKEYMLIENAYRVLIKEETRLLNKTRDKIRIKAELVEACEYYMSVRKEFNDHETVGIKSAARLLFLQNHCFNGVYRENGSGYYNTPFNWDHKTFEENKIIKKVQDVHNVFKLFELQLTSGSFENIDFKENTLFYLDPPYINEEELIENRYSKSGFGADMQLSLIAAIKPHAFIYSNHKHPLLLQEFNAFTVTPVIHEIGRKNIISASNESRKTDKLEILVVKQR